MALRWFIETFMLFPLYCMLQYVIARRTLHSLPKVYPGAVNEVRDDVIFLELWSLVYRTERLNVSKSAEGASNNCPGKTGSSAKAAWDELTLASECMEHTSSVL